MKGDKKLNFRSINYFSGASAVYQMEMLATLTFWPLYHNAFHPIQEAFFHKDDYFGPTIIAGVIAGQAAVTASHPFDLVRTMKILNEEQFGNMTNFQTLVNIFRLYGIHGLLSGKH